MPQTTQERERSNQVTTQEASKLFKQLQNIQGVLKTTTNQKQFAKLKADFDIINQRLNRRSLTALRADDPGLYDNIFKFKAARSGSDVSGTNKARLKTIKHIQFGGTLPKGAKETKFGTIELKQKPRAGLISPKKELPGPAKTGILPGLFSKFGEVLEQLNDRKGSKE